jgi:hypothetical protein
MRNTEEKSLPLKSKEELKIKEIFMKKLLLALGLLSLVSIASASVQAPRARNGEILPTIDFVGALPCTLDSTDSTTAKICGSTSIAGVGVGLVYGVMFSSDVATAYIVFRDTQAANTTSSTAAIVCTTAQTNSDTKTKVIRFPVPLQFKYGISVNASASPGTQPAFITIFYRPMTAAE